MGHACSFIGRDSGALSSARRHSREPNAGFFRETINSKEMLVVLPNLDRAEIEIACESGEKLRRG